MDIKRNGSQPSAKGPAEWFTGNVRIEPLHQAPAPARVSAASFQGSGPVRLGTAIGLRAADDVRLYGNALSDAQVSALVPRSAPCEINADVEPRSGLKIPQVLQLSAADTNACSVPVEYHWQCQSDTSVECAAFLSEANAGPYGIATPVLNLQEFDIIQIGLTICEVDNPSNCSSLLRIYEGAPID